MEMQFISDLIELQIRARVAHALVFALGHCVQKKGKEPKHNNKIRRKAEQIDGTRK